MRLAKRSSAYNRLYKKNYKINYIDCLVQLLIRKGFKLKAYKIIANFLIKIKIKFKEKAVNILNMIFTKYLPSFCFVSKKVAANVYQLPYYIDKKRASFLLIRWFLESAKSRVENKLIDKLYYEFLDLSLGYGKTIRKLEEYYSLAIKNRPFMKFLRRRRKVFGTRLKKYGIRKKLF